MVGMMGELQKREEARLVELDATSARSGVGRVGTRNLGQPSSRWCITRLLDWLDGSFVGVRQAQSG